MPCVLDRPGLLAIVVRSLCCCEQVTLEELQEWLSDRLPPYQIPRELKVVDSIPRNAMGKINKKELRRTLF
jgi:acyl-CoA synthetase (AMP-forming)/AMP-acid ligase II